MNERWLKRDERWKINWRVTVFCFGKKWKRGIDHSVLLALIILKVFSHSKSCWKLLESRSFPSHSSRHSSRRQQPFARADPWNLPDPTVLRLLIHGQPLKAMILKVKSCNDSTTSNTHKVGVHNTKPSTLQTTTAKWMNIPILGLPFLPLLLTFLSFFFLPPSLLRLFASWFFSDQKTNYLEHLTPHLPLIHSLF